jgi:DNA-binding Lrp family transcriptional regulator
MISAYVLAKMKSNGNIQKTIDQMKDISFLKSISVISGNHDLMVHIQIPNLEMLYEVTLQIHENTMVSETSTHIIEWEIQKKLN